MLASIKDTSNSIDSQIINLSKPEESQAFEKFNRQSIHLRSSYIQDNSLINSMQINDSMNYFPYENQETNRPLVESTVIEARKDTDNAIQTIINKYLKSGHKSQNSNNNIQESLQLTPLKDNKHSTMFTNTKIEEIPIIGMINKQIAIGDLKQSKIVIPADNESIHSIIKNSTQEKNNLQFLKSIAIEHPIHHHTEVMYNEHQTSYGESQMINATYHSYFPRNFDTNEEVKLKNTYFDVVPAAVKYEKNIPVVVEHRNYNLKHYTEINPAAYETEYVRFEKYDANEVVTDKVIAKDDFGIHVIYDSSFEDMRLIE